MKNGAPEFNSGAPELSFAPMDWILGVLFQSIGVKVISSPIDWNLARCFPI